MSDTISCTGVVVDLGQVERVLARRPEVVEAVAFGVTDNFLGEALQVFVVLADATEASYDLKRELQKAVKAEGLGVEPRSVRFVAAIPHLADGTPARAAVAAVVNGAQVDAEGLDDPSALDAVRNAI